MKRKRILIPILTVMIIVALIVATGCAGDTGLKGTTGSSGPQGIQGEPGEKGEPGLQGEIGSQGEAGIQGVMGRTGQKGATGSTGATGEQGPRGFSGYGAIGPTGATGATGAAGATGSQGGPGPQYFVITLGVKTSATAIKTVGTTVRLTTTGTPGAGDEARITITVSPSVYMTLGQLMEISWWENLTVGYPPHVDVILDLDGNGTADDALVFEYAHNSMTHYGEAPMPYGALTAAWYPVFSDDGNGPAVIGNASFAWLTS